MTERTNHSAAPDDLRERVTLTEPAGSSGLGEFVHALAAILARLDVERRDRVQSEPFAHTAPQSKEQR